MTLTMNPLRDKVTQMHAPVDSDMQINFQKEFKKGTQADFQKLTALFATMCVLHNHQVQKMHHESAANQCLHNAQHVKNLQNTYGVLTVKTVAVVALNILAGALMIASPLGVFANMMTEKGMAAAAVAAGGQASQLGAQAVGQFQALDKEKQESERLTHNSAKELTTMARDEDKQAHQQAQANVDKHLKMLEEIRQQEAQAKQSMTR